MWNVVLAMGSPLCMYLVAFLNINLRRMSYWVRNAVYVMRLHMYSLVSGSQRFMHLTTSFSV